MRKMKAAELILDFELYPRNNIDPKNVKRMIDALVGGIELPPVIIDRKSKRVVDGFHRVRANLRLYGDDASIEVIEKSYKDEAAIFLDATRFNATHGLTMDDCDRTHCIIIARHLHISDDAIAGALFIPVDKIATMRNERTALDSAGQPLALKNTIRQQFKGRKLTKRQTEANEKFSGMNQAFYANQLIELCESRMLDVENESLMERLRVLNGLLDDVLAVK